ncbi:FMN-binding glutamate synthase family protein [Ammoniphilus oxalaticus]|uniref:FMN-binding glutamate synthase family protein n=1 Tax=Ammoniphilus oxalaticus TaxID=66863 RepID=UPI001FE5B7E0|nr:FMN-binding glutamate synthase family protein [Ammoniphilus oxalaticus]
MNTLTIIAIIVLAILLVMFLTPVVFLMYVYRLDRKQEQHSILKNFPLLARARYFLEHIGPELRQYIMDGDNDGKPFTRLDFQTIVKSGKYLKTVIGFGSKRDFDQAGYYIKNTLIPKQMNELRVDNTEKIQTKMYIEKDYLFSRTDIPTEDTIDKWLLADEDAVVVGPNCKRPFVVKGQIGMGGMSYGALGDHAISALSQGLGMAGGTWMNTGEGGLSEYHLSGGVDIMMQIGPGLNGVRELDGTFSWEKLKEQSLIPQVKAFELKLGQGAKIRGGHLDGKKVTPKIAQTRGVEPWKTINSPNRFKEFHDIPSMLDFVDQIKQHTGKPVGIKIVIGDHSDMEELANQMLDRAKYPDFITVDGGEGGTGATYREMADSVGLPLRAALQIVDRTLITYGLRDKIKIIASGKLFSADRIAIALGMGADLINIARAFMITVGCIGTEKCHTGECPVGVATTDPNLQKALVVEEKKYRVLNYLVTLRQGLYALSAATGLDTPTQYSQEHIVYKTSDDQVVNLRTLNQAAKREQDPPIER